MRNNKRRRNGLDTLSEVAVFVGILALGFLASYGLAKAGHPGSVWLWRDIIGVL